MNSKTKIINICGGPGTGKSTIATGVYSKLKIHTIDCELASEYAKDVTWEGHDALFNNQIKIFAEQFRRIYRLLDKVDYIICDSPLLLNSIYLKSFLESDDKKFFSSEYYDQQKQFYVDSFDEFNNLNFYVTRNTKYHTMSGRVHDLRQSIALDKEISELLTACDPTHYVCTGETDVVIDDIVNVIIHGYNGTLN